VDPGNEFDLNQGVGGLPYETETKEEDEIVVCVQNADY